VALFQQALPSALGFRWKSFRENISKTVIYEETCRTGPACRCLFTGGNTVFPGERLGRPAYGAAEDEVPAARSYANCHDPIGFLPDTRDWSSTAACADPRSGNLV